MAHERNSLQGHPRTQCSPRSRQHTAKHSNSLRHTTTCCNTLQHAATQCKHMAQEHSALQGHCNAMQRTVTHCNTLQIAKERNALQGHCNTQQHTATSCKQMLQERNASNTSNPKPQSLNPRFVVMQDTCRTHAGHGHHQPVLDPNSYTLNLKSV